MELVPKKSIVEPTTKRKTRRRRIRKQRGGANIRIEDWVSNLVKHRAYRSQPDEEFTGQKYEFSKLQTSMSTDGTLNLQIKRHDIQSGSDNDELSRLDADKWFETPTYLYDVGVTVASLIGHILKEPNYTPEKFAALVAAMRNPGAKDDQLRNDADFGYAASLEFLTRVEKILRRIAGQIPDDNILTDTNKYPLFIWALVMNLELQDIGNEKKIPDPTVPMLDTTTQQQTNVSTPPAPVLPGV
jgi:hypothetical protein